jgi:hypothetical protein
MGEAGRMELHLESFPLGPLIDDVAKTIEPMATKNGNHIVIACRPEFRSGSILLMGVARLGDRLGIAEVVLLPSRVATHIIWLASAERRGQAM